MSELIIPNADDLVGWRSSPGLWFGLARLWSRYSPRGKGAVPRALRGLMRDRVVVTTEHGAMLAVAPRAVDTAAMVWAMGGVYEPHVVDACVRLLRPGESFFDIGANLGVISMETAQQVPGAKVMAVEPQAELARHVAISAVLNKFDGLRVYWCLIGEHDEVRDTELHIPKHSIHASLVSRSGSACVEVVPQLSLDALVAHDGLPLPDVVKLDVEGAELLVLRGGKESLGARPASVVFEADQNMKRFGYERSELFKTLLTIAKYSFWYIPDDRSSPRPLASPARAVWDGNYIACAPRQRSRLIT